MNNILNKIAQMERNAEEIQLASHKVELGIIQDDIKKVQSAQTEFKDGFLVVSFARGKAIPMIKNAIVKAENFLAQVEQAKKIAKELGVDLPKDYLDLQQSAGVLVGEAQDIIDWLNKY